MKIQELTGYFSYKDFVHPMFRNTQQVADQPYNKASISPNKLNNDYEQLLSAKPETGGGIIPLEYQTRRPNDHLS